MAYISIWCKGMPKNLVNHVGTTLFVYIFLMNHEPSLSIAVTVFRQGLIHVFLFSTSTILVLQYYIDFSPEQILKMWIKVLQFFRESCVLCCGNLWVFPVAS